MTHLRRSARGRKQYKAFTLIELLVVVAIIAVLISILLPSLSAARAQARAAVCAAHLNHVGKACAMYQAEENAAYPASYLYAADSDQSGRWKWEDQTDDFGRKNHNPYIHWSWHLYNQGKVDDGAFQCPEMRNGGVPRTICEKGQELAGQHRPPAPDDVVDLQAPFVAFTANHAVIPRNKFYDNTNGTSTRRFNRFVKEAEVTTSRRVVLATEFNENWRLASQNLSGSGLSGTYLAKGHRPLTGLGPQGSSGNDGNWMYSVQKSGLKYFFYVGNGIKPNYGVLPAAAVGPGSSTPYLDKVDTWNAIGRHHPGSVKGENQSGEVKDYGGTTNFLYVDGAVERKSILKVMQDMEWGHKFYSLTGRTDVEIGF